jgi:hypothetical protein
MVYTSPNGRRSFRKLRFVLHYKNVKCKKVKLFLCLKHHSKWGVEVQLHTFLISALDEDRWSASCPGRLIAGRIIARHPLGRSGYSEEKHFCASWELNTDCPDVLRIIFKYLLKDDLPARNVRKCICFLKAGGAHTATLNWQGPRNACNTYTPVLQL